MLSATFLALGGCARGSTIEREQSAPSASGPIEAGRSDATSPTAPTPPAARTNPLPLEAVSATETVKLLSLLRGQDWGAHAVRGIKLKPGEDVFVARYTVHEIPGTKLTRPIRAKLIDQSGKQMKYVGHAATSLMQADAGVGSWVDEDAFLVPRTATLKSLSLNAVTIDLGLPNLASLVAASAHVEKIPTQVKKPAQTPSVRVGRANVVGGLSENVVTRVLSMQVMRFRFCYDKAIATNPALRSRSGTIRVRFEIGADGQVSRATDGGSKVLDFPTGCFITGVYGIEFPQPAGGRASIVADLLVAATR